MSRIATLAALVLMASVTVWAGDKPLQSYDTLVVQRFTVAPDVAAKGDFPSGYEDVLQKTLFARLLTERVFSQVMESTDKLPDAPHAIVMAGEVAEFGKGSRAARVAVGYGAGSAKLKVVVIFREPNGREVLRLQHTGRYAGFGNLTGGSAQTAQNESARKVVEGLVKSIKAAR